MAHIPPVAFLTHADCLKHNMGSHHPECPERLDAIQDQLIASGVDALLERHEAPRGVREDIERVHPPEYFDAIATASPAKGIVHLDPDTAMSPGTWDAALRAVGAAVAATDLVATAKASTAFCSVRPPGHHAETARPMGFCFFNNVAIAARRALEVHGLERVAIVDFDVHHGNGTEEIFSDDPRVLMVSTFQHPFYPYSGTERPAANMVNVPLSAGTGGQGLRDAWDHAWLPALEAHRPQMIFISAGFDAHVEDDMASLRFTENDYAWITRELKGIADKHAQGRIVSVLEGGYALSALGRSVVAHIKALGDF